MITDLGTRLVSYPFIHKRKTTATTFRIVRLLGRWTREHCRGIRSMRKNQDPSMWIFYYFYIYVICRSSLCQWKIMIDRVVVHYDWQSSSLYAQKCLERLYLWCLYLLHNFVLHIRRYIHSCKSHLQLQCRLPHFGKGCLCTGSLRFIKKLCIRGPRLFICWGK